MVFNKNRKIEITLGIKKGLSYKKTRTVIKERGKQYVEIEPEEHILLIKLMEND